MAQRHGDFVGVFDSGVGGISVLGHLTKELPRENFLFFGDSLYAPYGEKSRDWVLNRSRDIVDSLIEQGAKAIVIACNTATSVAASTLRAEYAHIPIIGVEPALKPAVTDPRVNRVLVMATPITLRLDKFQQLAKKWGEGHEVIGVPCPGLADCIERGDLESPELHELVGQLVGEYAGKVDAVVLGCTHYPFCAHVIREKVGDVMLFDGGAGTARQLHRKLAERDLETRSRAQGNLRFASSNENEGEIELYKRYFAIASSLAE